MAPWSFLSGSGSEAEAELPAHMEADADQSRTAFTIFIDGALTNIYNEASGRSKDQRALRASLKGVIDEIRKQDDTGKKRKIEAPLDESITRAVLEPLQMACVMDVPRIAEPALGCLHKLVSHAYLHGESSASGRLDDGSIVSQVVSLIQKCSESNGETVQLGMVRALLTVTTAEHFVLHGDALISAVRAVFNIAIGADSADLQRTARSALLQMLNTVVKRITMATVASRASSITTEHPLSPGQLRSAAREGPETLQQEQSTPGTAEKDVPGRSAEQATGSSHQANRAATTAAADDTAQPPAETDGMSSSAAGRAEANGHHDVAEAAQQADEVLLIPADPAEDELAAQEQRMSSSDGEPPRPGTSGTRTAQLASLAEQADLRGLEKALDQIEAERSAKSGVDAAAMAKAAGIEEQASPQDVRRVMMRGRKVAAWKRLTLPERDVLTCLTAICKMAARETGFGAVEQYMHAGKLLALELLVRVLENPHHHWSALRPEFCEQLRQPLCLALLRNCTSVFDEAFSAAARLFTAILLQPKLRAGLKAELGAFYPLLLLRPMEAERPEPGQLHSALSALQDLSSQPQLLVDLFVNYDCDLQAANLFERTLRGLARIVRAGEASPGVLHAVGPIVNVNAAARPKPYQLAADVALLIIQALDEWADPLKETTEAASGRPADETEANVKSSGSSDTSLSHTASAAGGDSAAEMARFGAAKERKHSREAGIALFNRNPVKGVAALIGSGTVDSSPGAVAAFLRAHLPELDRTQLGEYFGHHDKLAIAVMYDYIDGENFSCAGFDDALRSLLATFRLPGEAQKIERIMEKFAERYCRDNPGQFRTADGAYVLSFALIMLNTDAHNPQADKKLSQSDFINMCQDQNEHGAYEPILPVPELERMYQRILAQELVVNEPQLASASAAGGARPRRPSRLQGRGLAAAVGMTQMTLPFRSGAAWDKQHGVDVERERLVAHTREAVTKGLASGSMWHAATNAEHARPMLQVGGDAILKALSAAEFNAPDAEASAPVLQGFTTVIRLCGVVGLDKLGDDLVAALATAAGVHAPAPPGTLAEEKQVAALKTLVRVASGPEAGLLGSGWVTILRCLSLLEALQSGLPVVPRDAAPKPPPSRQASVAQAAAPHRDAAAAGGAAPEQAEADGPLQRGQSRAPRATGLGRFLSRMGMASETVAPEGAAEDEDSAAAGDPDRSSRSTAEDVPSRQPSSHLRTGLGSGLANWAEGPGREGIEKVYMSSRSLSGDAIVIFMRALCAVSQEELLPANPEEPARVYTLQRIMDAAFDNLNRIRLIWGRLWAALAAHLVSAACHSDPRVSVLAVGHMRALVQRLLSRSELSCFTHQDEALRPFVAVLRHAENALVREMTVQVMSQAVSTNPKGLGSAWRSILEALGVAAGDHSVQVVSGALVALQQVIDLLFQGGSVGMEHFDGVVMAGASTMRSPLDEDLSITAMWVLQSVAKRLAGAPDSELERRSSGALLQSSASPGPPGGGAQRSAAAKAWGTLLSAYALVARHDPRPRVADTAGAALLDVMQKYSSSWSAEAWAEAYGRALAYVFELPHARTVESAEPQLVGWSVEGLARVQRQAQELLPRLFPLQADCFQAAAPHTLQPSVRLLVSYVVSAHEALAVAGVQLLQSLVAVLAPILDAPGWTTIIQGLSIASSTDHLSSIFNSRGSQSAPAPWAAQMQVQPEAEALRCYCRVAVLMQRACDAVHARNAQHMPLDAQLRLLSVLQDTVQRAAAFNRSLTRRAEAARVASPAAAVQEPLPASSPASGAAIATPAEQASQMGARVGKASAEAAGSMASQTEAEPALQESPKDAKDSFVDNAAPAQDAEAPAQPGRIMSPSDSADVSGKDIPPELPGTTSRGLGIPETQENSSEKMPSPLGEGSGSSRDLQESQEQTENQEPKAETDQQAPDSSSAGAPEVASTPRAEPKPIQDTPQAEQLLPALMRQEAEGGILLISAYMRILQPQGDVSQQGDVSEAESRLLTLCRRFVADAAEDAWARHQAALATGASDIHTWDEAARAPLLVAVLRGYRSICGEAWQAELRSVFPHLTHLICSAQPSVRTALADLLQAQIPKMIA